MIGPETKRASGSSPWGWALVGMLLSLSLSLSLTDAVTLQLTPQYVMPILGGWLGHRYGWSATAPMLAMGGLAIFEFYWRLDGLLIDVGYDSGTYFLTLFCFATTALHSDTTRQHASWRHPGWSIALWVAVLSLAFGVFVRSPDPQDYSVTSIEFYERLGILACLASLSCLLNWRMLVGQHNRGFFTLFAIIAIVLLLGLNIRFVHEIYIETDFASSISLTFFIGLFWPSHWLFALCFAVSVVAALDWRLVCAALAGMFIVSITITGQWSPIWDAYPFLVVEDGDARWTELPSAVSDAWKALRDAICALLLGAALQPLRISFVVDQSRMAKFLGAVLAVHFFIPGDHSGYPLIASCVAFAGSLAWNIRALIAGPFIILLCAMVSYGFALGSQDPGQLTQLAIAFPSAFLGVLVARRLTSQSFDFRVKPILHRV